MGGQNEPITLSTETRKKLSERGYRIGKQIGYGSYSNVYRGKKKGNLDVAVKVIDLNKATSNYRNKFFPREFNMITRIRHKYIILTYDIYKEQDPNKGLNRVFIFMELARTDLLSVIEKRGRVDELQSKVWFYEICQGLAYLHSKHFSHRDLKVENLLINSQNVAVISDFGFVKESPWKMLSSTYCGSVQYAAPEIRMNRPYDPFAADVWSLGICIYATLTGQMPFLTGQTPFLTGQTPFLTGQTPFLTGQTPFRDETLHLLKSEERNVRKILARADVSVAARDLLSKMLRHKEKDRIKMKDVLDHDWFKGMNLHNDHA